MTAIPYFNHSRDTEYPEPTEYKYIESTEYNNASGDYGFQLHSLAAEAGLTHPLPEEEGFGQLEEETADPAPKRSSGRRTTDLVRLYLQDIGRVRLLGRDEEVVEAQKIRRYMRLLELRQQSIQEQSLVEGQTILQQYSQLMELRDRLTASLGHRPTLERLAREAGTPVQELKPILSVGKQVWAEVVGLTVK